MITGYLVGDVGGRNSRLAVFKPRAMDPKRAAPTRDFEWAFASDAERGFDRAFGGFMGDGSIRPKAGVLAVAGTVVDGVAKLAFPRWTISAADIEAKFNQRMILITDAEAAAEGIAALKDKERLTLQAGPAGAGGDRVVLHVGTSLRASILRPDSAVRALPSPVGAHELVPRSDLQHLLIETTRLATGKPVTIDTLVSSLGPGFLYQFTHSHEQLPRDKQISAAIDADPMAAAEVLVEYRKDPLCVSTLKLYIELLGGVAADVVNATGATGGLYLTGEIPALLAKPLSKHLLAPFRARADPERGLDEIGVHVVKTDRVGLLGAARRAKSLVP